jgi:hypothetical protein
MKEIRIQEITVTQGRSVGETGTGYLFLGPDDNVSDGDISSATHGYYQGSERVILATLHADDKYCLGEMMGGGYALFNRESGRNITEDPIRAREMGLVTWQDD